MLISNAFENFTATSVAGMVLEMYVFFRCEVLPLLKRVSAWPPSWICSCESCASLAGLERAEPFDVIDSCWQSINNMHFSYYVVRIWPDCLVCCATFRNFNSSEIRQKYPIDRSSYRQSYQEQSYRVTDTKRSWCRLLSFAQKEEARNLSNLVETEPRGSFRISMSQVLRLQGYCINPQTPTWADPIRFKLRSAASILAIALWTLETLSNFLENLMNLMS